VKKRSSPISYNKSEFVLYVFVARAMDKHPGKLVLKIPPKKKSLPQKERGTGCCYKSIRNGGMLKVCCYYHLPQCCYREATTRNLTAVD